MARNMKIEAIEAAEAKVAQFVQVEADFRRTAMESDGIDAQEQATIDRINGKIKELQTIIQNLRAELERNKAIWEGRSGELAPLRAQADQVRAFGLSGIDPIFAEITTIEQSVADQRWADATAQLDRLKVNIVPIFANYVAQNGAKVAYTALRPTYDSRVSAVRAAATPEMSRTLGSLDSGIAEVDKSVQEKDYVEALAGLNDLIKKLEPLEDEIQVAAVGAELDKGATSVSGATYEVGPPKRPTIKHDNGFLQNPLDKNDPVPIPTREPTMEERLYYAGQLAQAEGANALSYIPFSDMADSRLGLDNGLAGYRHFLTGGGEDFVFDYESYLEDDPAGQRFKEDIKNDVKSATNEIYDDLSVDLPDTPNASVTFQMHGGQPKGGPPYPDTEDWQKAIGGHSVWSNSEITLTRQRDGTILATAKITLEAEDRYNFNPGQNDIATNVPDDERGVLEETGLAHQFTQRGTAVFETSWTIGTPIPGASGGGSMFGDR